jgi:Beta/Gamma crystallin
MSDINKQSQDIYNIAEVEEISNEAATNYSGGTGGTADVDLYSGKNFGGKLFSTNRAVADLSKFGFANIASSLRVNNKQVWRFYSDKDFKGHFIDIHPGQSLKRLKALNNDIESLKAIT